MIFVFLPVRMRWELLFGPRTMQACGVSSNRIPRSGRLIPALFKVGDGQRGKPRILSAQDVAACVGRNSMSCCAGSSGPFRRAEGGENFSLERERKGLRFCVFFRGRKKPHGSRIQSLRGRTLDATVVWPVTSSADRRRCTFASAGVPVLELGPRFPLAVGSWRFQLAEVDDVMSGEPRELSRIGFGTLKGARCPQVSDFPDYI